MFIMAHAVRIKFLIVAAGVKPCLYCCVFEYLFGMSNVVSVSSVVSERHLLFVSLCYVFFCVSIIIVN